MQVPFYIVFYISVTLSARTSAVTAQLQLSKQTRPSHGDETPQSLRRIFEKIGIARGRRVWKLATGSWKRRVRVFVAVRPRNRLRKSASRGAASGGAFLRRKRRERAFWTAKRSVAGLGVWLEECGAALVKVAGASDRGIWQGNLA